jgi:hypothetical protein
VDDGTPLGRANAIFGVTEHLVIPGLQTGLAFGDTGFRGAPVPGGSGFRDPHPSSRNQPGHFLTAARLLLDPEVGSRSAAMMTGLRLIAPRPPALCAGRALPRGDAIRDMVEAPAGMPDSEVALRLTIGHEKAPDPPGGFDVAMDVLLAGVVESFTSGPEGETEEQRQDRIGQRTAGEGICTHSNTLRLSALSFKQPRTRIFPPGMRG